MTETDGLLMDLREKVIQEDPKSAAAAHRTVISGAAKAIDCSELKW